MSRIRKISLIVSVLFLVLMAPQADRVAADEATLYFSAIPDQDETRLVKRFSKVADYLSVKLGVPVKYIPVKSYPAAVAAFRNGQIQLAWFGGLSGVQARLSTPGARAIAQGEEDKTFVSYFIAHESTGLKPSAGFPHDSKGMTFTFGAKTSTSGRLMPEFYIRKNTSGTPKRFYRRVGYSGDHSQTLRLVSSGAYQVGALNYSVYEAALANKDPATKTAVVVWKTPPYPDYNWTIHPDVEKTFGTGFVDQVRSALLDMKDAELLATFPRKSFIPATNSDYKPILDTAIDIGMITE